MRETLVLSRSDIRAATNPPALLTELREAMAGYVEDGRARRFRCIASEAVTATVLLPGLAPGVPAYTVKIHAKNPGRRPAITGVICLHDLQTGDLLAVLDSGWLTALRTGASAALGTHALARAGARRVGIVGAGAQGRAQLHALAALRPLDRVRVHDTDLAAAQNLVEYSRDYLRLPAHTAESAQAVAADCDVLLVATWSRGPLLALADVVAGTHITSLGADEPGKTELAPDLLSAALLVTDDRRLAEAVLPRTDTSLAAVLQGRHPGRTNDQQVTVYSPLGLPLQDCVVAWHTYCNALRDNLGITIRLEE